jgi:hypothetical protein
MFRFLICLFTNFCTNRQLIYLGGPIISDVKVITVWWGNNVKYRNELEKFYARIVKSNWFTTLNEYNILSGVWERSINYTAADKIVIDEQIIVNTMFNLFSDYAGKNYYFAVHLSSNISVITRSGVSCIDFYAYHTFVKGIYYGIIPECINDSVNLNLFDSITHASSHELAETVTDPEPRTGWIFDTSDTSDEVADICSALILTVDNYKLNSLYSNRYQRCMSDPSVYMLVLAILYVSISMLILIGVFFKWIKHL